MKKSYFFTVFLILFCFNELSAFPPSIGTYRWRNDDGNETLATWMAPEQDSIFHKGEGNIRLRMEVVSGGDYGYSGTTALYYRQTGDTNNLLWHRISDDENEVFTFSLSPYIIDGEPTTSQLTNSSGTVVDTAGFIRELPGYFNYFINTLRSSELEFCIKASPKADFDNKMYSFIIESAEDTTGIFWLGPEYHDSLLPTIVLQKTTLTVTANNANKVFGHSNPSFSVTYSGFVDGDDASVLDTLPDINCTANLTSPVGSYPIVPSGAYDNKYDFVYVNGSLAVVAPSDLNNAESDALTVYPNPATDNIYLKGKIPANAIAQIFDLTGRLVIEQEISSKTIDISKLATGRYILKIGETVFNVTKE